jgi:hypothetical protein
MENNQKKKDIEDFLKQHIKSIILFLLQVLLLTFGHYHYLHYTL